MLTRGPRGAPPTKVWKQQCQEPTAPRPSPPRPSARARSSASTPSVASSLVSALVLALVTALSVVFFYRHLNGNIETGSLEALGRRPPGEGLHGQRRAAQHPGDGRRHPLRRGQRHRPGGAAAAPTPPSSSTCPPTASRAYAISIPRDSIVDRPECGDSPAATEVMWNAAFTVGERALHRGPVRADDRDPARPLRGRRLQRLRRHGRRRRRRAGLRPRGHRRPASTRSSSRRGTRRCSAATRPSTTSGPATSAS